MGLMGASASHGRRRERSPTSCARRLARSSPVALRHDTPIRGRRSAKRITPRVARRPPPPMVALTALTSHVRELETGIGTGVLGAVRAVAQILPLALALAWMAPRLALGSPRVVLGAVLAVALGRARRAWKRANARAARHREALLEAADEAVRHAELWTTYGAERRVRAHVDADRRALSAQGARIDASAAGAGRRERGPRSAGARPRHRRRARAGSTGAGARGCRGSCRSRSRSSWRTARSAISPTRAWRSPERASRRTSIAPLFCRAPSDDSYDEVAEPRTQITWPLAVTVELDALRLARGRSLPS